MSELADKAIEDFKTAVSHRPQTWNIDAFESAEDTLMNASQFLRL